MSLLDFDKLAKAMTFLSAIASYFVTSYLDPSLPLDSLLHSIHHAERSQVFEVGVTTTSVPIENRVTIFFS